MIVNKLFKKERLTTLQWSVNGTSGLDIATVDGKQAENSQGLRQKLGKDAFSPEELANIDREEPR